MNWWRRIIRVCKVLLPINLLLAGAALACLEYPVFRLRDVEIVFSDGREVNPELRQRVLDVVTAEGDSNLFSTDENKIAQSILEGDDDLVRVETRLILPDKLYVRLFPAQPTLWWSDRKILSLAGDGRSVGASDPDRVVGHPIGVGDVEADEVIERWRLIEFYQRLVKHDPRWAEVVSQIKNDPETGWLLVLNEGAERIILGQHPDAQTFDLVVRFLEIVPEDQWARATIDARFGGKVIVTPPAAKSRSSRKTHRENSSLPVGGRS